MVVHSTGSSQVVFDRQMPLPNILNDINSGYKKVIDVSSPNEQNLDALMREPKHSIVDHSRGNLLDKSSIVELEPLIDLHVFKFGGNPVEMKAKVDESNNIPMDSLIKWKRKLRGTAVGFESTSTKFVEKKKEETICGCFSGL